MNSFVDHDWLWRNVKDVLLPAIGQIIRDEIKKAETPLKQRIAALEETLGEFGYRGMWQEGIVYRSGNFVTLGGSLWHCDESATTSRPDTHNPDWSLAVKRGRDAPRSDPRKPIAARTLGHNG